MRELHIGLSNVKSNAFPQGEKPLLFVKRQGNANGILVAEVGAGRDGAFAVVAKLGLKYGF